MDAKARDLSPVLNLSKSGHGDHDANSLDGDARSERSDEDEVNSTAASIRDDEENQHNHHSDDNASDVDERADKEDGEWIRDLWRQYLSGVGSVVAVVKDYNYEQIYGI